ncbi:MAG: hypothetical protein K2H64_01620 [Desulfovibrio sp.]|nr:hypothetical protein [Desulfovibrio sp.]
MKTFAFRALACAFAILLTAGVFLWQFSRSSAKNLETAKRQFVALSEKIAGYENLKGSVGDKANPAEDLYAAVNRAAARCGVGDRLENLRPARDKSGEALDLRLRSLYLGEAMRFLSQTETLDRTSVERLTLRRDANNLLDLEMRLRREGDGL